MQTRGVIAAVASLGLLGCSEERPAPAASLTGDAGSDATLAEAGVLPICNPDKPFGTAQRLGAASAEVERFGAISGDELTVAWLVAIDDATANVFYADRASRSDPFGPAQSLAPAPDYFALDSVALAPDGLRLVVVRADRHGFGVAARASRTEPFAAPEPDEYSNLNPYQRDSEPRDSLVGDPVLSADGLSFVYSEYRTDIVDTVRLSVRQYPEDSWASTEPVLAFELAAEAGLRRRPTGISNDLRTLFFWDEIAGSEWAAWRRTPLDPFDELVNLGAFDGAQPNARCSRVYFTSGDDLAFADAAR